jgi:hypothetical protein
VQLHVPAGNDLQGGQIADLRGNYQLIPESLALLQDSCVSFSLVILDFLVECHVQSCIPGQYQNASGKSYCSDCPAGRRADTGASSWYVLCISASLHSAC